MNEGTEELARSIALLTREARAGVDHLAPETLAAYRAAELPPGEAERVRDHLAICRHCADLLLDLGSFEDPGAGAPADPAETAAAEAALDAVWRKIEARQATAPPPPTTPARQGGGPWRPLTTSPLTTYALAAGLAACLVGFPLWIAHRDRSQPAPPILRLASLGAARGLHPVTADSAPRYPLATLRLNAPATILELDLSAGRAFPRYQVEILDARARIRSPANWRQATPQMFLVVLTREQLPPGDHRIRVTGLENGQATRLADFPLRILAP
ncbi:MAG: zf-HC2 domain-containing protein [Acidobacteriota bacterium]|nr:zf-HC2 domain-containing protein [Acidobacteriota bacterium]